MDPSPGMLSVRVLWALGMWPGRNRVAYGYYSAFVVLMVALHMGTELVALYFIRADLQRFVTVMCIMLTGVGCLAKMLNIMFRHDHLRRIVEDVQEASGVAERRITASVVGLWLVTTFAWILVPLASSYATDELPFMAWFPFTTVPGSWGHAAAYLFQGVTGLEVGTIVATLDSFYVGIAVGLAAQLRALRGELERARLSDGGRSRDLAACVAQHQRIISCVHDVQVAFGSVMLLQFSISCFLICMVGFQATLSTVTAGNLFKCLLYLGVSILQLLLYCKFGEDLIEQSTLLGQAAYGTDWYDSAERNKHALMFIMQRAQRPLALTAGGFYPVSLRTFAQILNSSYTYFALLKQLNE